MNSGKPSLAMLPWYPGDFMTATRAWSVTAKGVYRELLDAQWNLGFLPVESSKLRQISGASRSEWRQFERYLDDKFPAKNNQRRNLRLEQHRAKSYELTAKRSSSGKAGASARWQTHADANAIANADANGKRTILPMANGALLPMAPSPSPSPSGSSNHPHTEFSPTTGAPLSQRRAAHGKGSVGVKSRSGWKPPKSAEEIEAEAAEREEAAREEGELAPKTGADQDHGVRHAER